MNVDLEKDEIDLIYRFLMSEVQNHPIEKLASTEGFASKTLEMYRKFRKLAVPIMTPRQLAIMKFIHDGDGRLDVAFDKADFLYRAWTKNGEITLTNRELNELEEWDWLRDKPFDPRGSDWGYYTITPYGLDDIERAENG